MKKVNKNAAKAQAGALGDSHRQEAGEMIYRYLQLLQKVEPSELQPGDPCCDASESCFALPTQCPDDGSRLPEEGASCYANTNE